MPPSAGARPRLAWPELLIGVGALLFAIVVFAQTRAIPVSPLYSKVGPTVFPYLTVGGLGVLSVLLLVQGVRGGWQDTEEAAVRPDWLRGYMLPERL